jgi:hypothetical protein
MSFKTSLYIPETENELSKANLHSLPLDAFFIAVVVLSVAPISLTISAHDPLSTDPFKVDLVSRFSGSDSFFILLISLLALSLPPRSFGCQHPTRSSAGGIGLADKNRYVCTQESRRGTIETDFLAKVW